MTEKTADKIIDRLLKDPLFPWIWSSEELLKISVEFPEKYELIQKLMDIRGKLVDIRTEKGYPQWKGTIEDLSNRWILVYAYQDFVNEIQMATYQNQDEQYLVLSRDNIHNESSSYENIYPPLNFNDIEYMTGNGWEV